MSYILPSRYARVNRVEVLLGEKAKPVPPPPTFEEMFRIPLPPVRPEVGIEPLRRIARQVIEARLRDNKGLMNSLLDDRFVFYRLQQAELNKGQFIDKLVPEPIVKDFDFYQTDLIFRQKTPVLSAKVRYESILGESKVYANTSTFVGRNGRWLVATWRSFSSWNLVVEAL